MRISDWSSDVCSSDLMVSFRPDAVFSLVRWTSNDYGTIHSRIDILRAVMPGEGYTTAPFVQPGGELYLSIQGWPKVRAVLAAIDAVDAAGVDPCEIGRASGRERGVQ